VSIKKSRKSMKDTFIISFISWKYCAHGVRVIEEHDILSLYQISAEQT